MNRGVCVRCVTTVVSTLSIFCTLSHSISHIAFHSERDTVKFANAAFRSFLCMCEDCRITPKFLHTPWWEKQMAGDHNLLLISMNYNEIVIYDMSKGVVLTTTWTDWIWMRHHQHLQLKENWV